jgi:broad-specificity NMP kinase
MIIETRALFNIGKNYCKLINLLEENNIQYYENEKFDEIVIDLDEYSYTPDFKKSIITTLYTNKFISFDEWEALNRQNINTLLFWR